MNLNKHRIAWIGLAVGIVLVIVVKTHIHALRVPIVIIAAGVCSRVTVNTGLQPLGMNVVGHRLQPVGEARGVYNQLPRLFVAPAKEPVVNIDVVIAHGLQPLVHHGIRLAFDKVFVDFHSIGIP